MKHLKKFESTKVNEEYHDEMMTEPIEDEICINLRALDNFGRDALLNLLKDQVDMIDDEDNQKAIEIIEKFRD